MITIEKARRRYEILSRVYAHPPQKAELTDEEKAFLDELVGYDIMGWALDTIEAWRAFGEHILAMDVMTPGGSNEAWCRRLLRGDLR